MSSDAGYAALVERVRDQVRASVRPGARVLVVSRGDEALLAVAGREMAHFPQSPTGLYAGHYPATGADAAAHLATLRAAGATHLVLPETALWWLEHYADLRAMLRRECAVVHDGPDPCMIFELRPDPARAAAAGEQRDLETARTAPQASALISHLLPEDAGVALLGAAAAAVDVGARRRWLAPSQSPAGETPVSELLAQVETACSAGARYVILLHPESPRDRLDGAVSCVLATRLDRVCAQHLLEIFELPPG